nr:hypothetical protein [Tanacetum cinerariifolium]
MSSSAVTYTYVYTDSEPWRFYRGSDEEPADAGSPGFIDPQEDHADYPVDRGDGDDEPSDDDEEEEEEHLALADSSVVLVVDHVPSGRNTKALETDEAQKTVILEPPMSTSMEARIAEHATAPTPPLPVSSPPLPLPSPLTTHPTNAGSPLGYRAAGINVLKITPKARLLPKSLEAPAFGIFLDQGSQHA